jgi:hypothetical protein
MAEEAAIQELENELRTINLNEDSKPKSPHRWNDKQEIYLVKLQNSCNLLHKFYTKNYFSNKYTLYYYKIPVIFLSSFNGLSSVGLQNFVKQEYISLTNAIISVGISIISSVELFVGVSNEMNSSLSSSFAFKRLSLDIGKELSIPRDEREFNGIVFLNQCYSRYVEIVANSIAVKKKMKDYLSIEQITEMTDEINAESKV